MIRKLLITVSGLTLLAAVTAAPAYARIAPAVSPLPGGGVTANLRSADMRTSGYRVLPEQLGRWRTGEDGELRLCQ